MNGMNIDKTISQLRREKGITQEELAEYIGVSKASVSKWETGHSYPDITFLPLLATFFNISIDNLVGYEPQMTKEDIRKLYLEICEDFASKPFDEIYDKCKSITKKYYSCYPLLLQISTIYLNHFMLANSPELQKEVLTETEKICKRIITNCDTVKLAKEAQSVQTTVYLISNQPEKVLEIYGEDLEPAKNELISISQAYQLLGKNDDALKALQVSMYQDLLGLTASTPHLIILNQNNIDMVNEILDRCIKVCTAFNMEDLHPNTMLNIYITAAQTYAIYNDIDNTLKYLKLYEELALNFFPVTLHSDDYFTKIDEWISNFALQSNAPRNNKIIAQSIVDGVAKNPAFEPLHDNSDYKLIIIKLNKLLEDFS